MSVPEPQAVFCDALLRLEELARAFTADNLRLERIVLRTGQSQSPQEAAGSAFNAPESTLGSQEVWRVKFLLLDIVYGEPTSAVTRIATDLTGERGRLRPAWELALALRAGALPAGGIDHVHRVIAEYGLECFRPDLAKCRALWSGLPAPERALLSPDVTAVMAQVTELLNALESAFSTVEHSCWVLQTAEHAARV